MKSITFVIGSISAIAIVLGILFSILHWKGASMLLLVGLGTTAIFFIPILTLQMYKKYKLAKV